MSTQSIENAAVSPHFDFHDADFEIISSDGVRFGVHQKALIAGSEIFQNMLADISPTADVKSSSLPSVTLQESLQTLDHLRYFDPSYASNSFVLDGSTAEDRGEFFRACDKYMLSESISTKLLAHISFDWVVDSEQGHPVYQFASTSLINWTRTLGHLPSFFPQSYTLKGPLRMKLLRFECDIGAVIGAIEELQEFSASDRFISSRLGKFSIQLQGFSKRLANSPFASFNLPRQGGHCTPESVAAAERLWLEISSWKAIMTVSHEVVVRMAESMEWEWKCQHCRHEIISRRRRLQNDVLRVNTDDQIWTHILSAQFSHMYL